MVTIPVTGTTLKEIERLAIVEALRMTNGVQTEAAKLLGISPRVINYKIARHGITITRYSTITQVERVIE